jgi:hypothetical protein
MESGEPRDDLSPVPLSVEKKIKDHFDSLGYDAWMADVKVDDAFFNDLEDADDWTFIIKTHALIESICTRCCVLALGEPALLDFFSRLENSNPRTGRVAALRLLGLLDKPYARAITKWSELRNLVVHDVAQTNFSLTNYLEEAGDGAQKAFYDTMALKDSYIEPNIKSKYNFSVAMSNPKRFMMRTLSAIFTKLIYDSNRRTLFNFGDEHPSFYGGLTFEEKAYLAGSRITRKGKYDDWSSAIQRLWGTSDSDEGAQEGEE